MLAVCTQLHGSSQQGLHLLKGLALGFRDRTLGEANGDKADGGKEQVDSWQPKFFHGWQEELPDSKVGHPMHTQRQ